MLYYDVIDNGTKIEKYRFNKKPDRAIKAKGMNNLFVNLTQLKPNTLYYCIIKDSDGLSRSLTFVTAPNDPATRISFISGGDSRNFREARQEANALVAKLHPHFVLFNGDMTDDDTDAEWVEWFNDWQLTITKEGLMTPVLVARGNHEYDNKTLVDVFCLKAKEVYYSTGFAGNLLRIYTLNSMIPTSGEQKKWFQEDLEQANDFIWKAVQYHCPMRPHNTPKPERNDQVQHWAALFHKYGIKLAMESDTHVAKNTFPIRPSNDAGNDEGFVRDDMQGTTYIGEGCWGAPLRQADDNKKWTRQSGSFNHFNWVWVDKYKMEIRTVKTDGGNAIAALPVGERFKLPAGINLWKHNAEDAIIINNTNLKRNNDDVILASNNGKLNTNTTKTIESPVEKLSCDVLGVVNVPFDLEASGAVFISLMNGKNQEVNVVEFKNQLKGRNSQRINIKKLPRGKYRVLVRHLNKVIKQYDVVQKG